MNTIKSTHTPDINEGVRRWQQTAGALLLDVRTRAEYAAAHIPGSLNIPLNWLDEIEDHASPETPVFVYCQSGVRSSSAVAVLKEMGYNNINNIGGIDAYRGKTEGNK